MGTDAGTGNPATLLSMMANNNAEQAILSSAGDMSTVQTKYHDISTSHLNDRLTAVESYIIPGYDANAGTLINGWVQECAASGKTRANGVRLDQIAQKTLWGAVSYWQATSKYMSKIETDDNSMPSGDAIIRQWSTIGMNHLGILELRWTITRPIPMIQIENKSIL